MLDVARNRIIISDLHLGKTFHFRKNGIAVPKGIAYKNIASLNKILERHQPKELLILGDLFHSKYNAEWEDFKALRYHYSNVRFQLVIGNHDSFPLEEYLKANIVVDDHLFEDGILYSHEPKRTDHFSIYGHIHPAIRLKGGLMPSLRLACFHITESDLIMPAFGAFTGTHLLKVNSKTRVLAIVEGKIFEPLSKTKKVTD